MKRPETALPEAAGSPLELAKRAANGDAAATAQLLRQLAPEVVRVVRGVMGPFSSDVDDAAQQALIAIIQALPAFRGECAPQGYACRIAFRTALAARKRARTARSRRDSSVDADGLEGDFSPAERRDANHRTDLLRNLLEELPPEQAEAIALRTMLGWSLEEIAEVAGAPTNTIRSRLRLAKEALRKKIASDPSLAEALGVMP